MSARISGVWGSGLRRVPFTLLHLTLTSMVLFNQSLDGLAEEAVEMKDTDTGVLRTEYGACAVLDDVCLWML